MNELKNMKNVLVLMDGISVCESSTAEEDKTAKNAMSRINNSGFKLNERKIQHLLAQN